METKCLTKVCSNNAKQRGLCTTCYLSALKLIKLGKTSDENLVEMGMMLPRKEKGTNFEKQFYKNSF